MQLLMVGVPSREIGLEALDRLDDAESDGVISIEDAALVYKNDKGKVKIHQTHGITVKRGVLGGGAVGLLVGASWQPRQSSPPPPSARARAP